MANLKMPVGSGGDRIITEINGIDAISVAAGANIVIPTSKKAKGAAFRMLQGSSHFLFTTLDGIGDNKIYRQDTKAYQTQTATYNDNNITISSLSGTSSYTVYPIVYY